MIHPGKAALHRLALLRTEKVGETGEVLGSILDYVATLETAIDQLRAEDGNDEQRPATRHHDNAATQLFLALKSPFGHDAQMREADIKLIGEALMSASCKDAGGSLPVGFADPVDIRVADRAFDVRRTANGRFTAALYLADTSAPASDASHLHPFKRSNRMTFHEPDVIALVIAAREFWDISNDLSEESRALDKALEPFAERVPYENQPEAATSSKGCAE